MADNTVAERLVTDLMRDFGLTREQAAGFAGNLSHESAGFTKYNEVGGGGVGLAQWTGPRRKQFESYAKQNDLSPKSYDANYGFLKHELTQTPEKAVINKLKAAPDVATATRIVSNQYLRPGVPRMESRLSQANSALQAIGQAAPGNAVSQALGYAPQQAQPMRAPSPSTQSNDMRLMRNPNMSPSAQRSATDSIVNNSFSPAPIGLQAALNSRVQRVAPEPAGIDDMMLARTGIGGSRIAPADSPVISASDRARGNTNVGVGLPQKTGNATSWNQFYSGITPAIAQSPIPATADERVTARNAAPNGNRVVSDSMSAVSATPKSAALQSALDRLAATKATAAQPISPAYNQVSQAQKLAMSAVPAAPPTYSASNPLVAAAQSAQQVASQRLAPSPRDVNIGWSDPQLGKIATSAPAPMPTIPRQAAPTQLVAQRPNVSVPDTQGLYGIPMTPNIRPQSLPVQRAAVNPVAQALAYQQPIPPPQQALQQIAIAQALNRTDPLSGRVYDGTNAFDRFKSSQGGSRDNVAQSLG